MRWIILFDQGNKSHAFQKATISAGVPRETRM